MTLLTKKCDPKQNKYLMAWFWPGVQGSTHGKNGEEGHHKPSGVAKKAAGLGKTSGLVALNYSEDLKNRCREVVVGIRIELA